MQFSERKKTLSSSVFITGASSGIGWQLALRYAKRGENLVLWGRNKERLEQIARLCRELGAGAIYTRSIDLTHIHELLMAFEEDQKKCFCSIYLLCAGLSDMKQTGEEIEDPQASMNTSIVNFSVPVSLATAAAQKLQHKGQKGEIVLIGSVAAFYEIPFATIYSGSKAGLAFFAKTAQLAWQKFGISVVLISPAFVDTPMSQKLKRSRPFLVSAPKAADMMMKAIDAKKKHYIFPWPFRVLRVIERLLPLWVREKILLSLKEG